MADIGDVSVNDVAEIDGRLVAVGSSWGGAPRAVILVSDDGIDWEQLDLASLDLDSMGTSWIGTVLAGPGGLVASGYRSEFGIPVSETFLLHSVDGLTWEELAFMRDCAFAGSMVSGDFGWLTLTGPCQGEGPGAPPPVSLQRSVDGVHWDSQTVDAFSRSVGPPNLMATDGHGIVAIQYNGASIWQSSDGGTSWELTEPFEANVALDSLTYGHRIFVAYGSQLVRPGDPDRIACISPTGAAWSCSQIDDVIRDVVPTPTGFVTIETRDSPNGPWFAVAVGTSLGGLSWQFELHRALANLRPHGSRWTSHGLLVWGGSNPNTEPSGHSVPYLRLHPMVMP